MLVVDRSCDISFGTYDCFFKRCIVCMFIEHIVLTFVHQQIRLGIETQGSGFIDEMNAGMKISGCKLLLAVRTSRFEVKITQSEVTGNIQIQLVKLVCIIYVGTCTVIECIPFLAVGERNGQFTVHSIHLEAYIQFVFIRQAE